MSIAKCLRGMRDIQTNIATLMRDIEQVLINTSKQFGYQEIRFPQLEHSSLFEKSIGIETDVVGQEMYQFTDKNGDVISLRPEGTAGCLRSAIQTGLIPRQRQKLFYLGQMFRRERPQKGRYREFAQFGVEAYGYPDGLIDVELIALTSKMWEALGINMPKLYINYLGKLETRLAYRSVLSQYWQKHLDQLSEEEQVRAKENPLRLLDSKNPALSHLINGAPSLLDHLSADEQEAFHATQQTLDQLGIKYEVSSQLVRGLDYYSDFVFEWVSDDLGAQGTICGGGRYDLLCHNMGCDTPATGFAIGIDRLALLLGEKSSIVTKVFICAQEAQHLQSNYANIVQHQQQLNLSINIDFQTKKIKKIHAAKDKGYTHSILIEEDSFKLVDHTISTIERYPIKELFKQLKNLESLNAES
ncbi:histidine--tRNA ligase [Gammaproteobacteria bacterium]|nr:histidine--tRNA ligase [Gammaproteobacteria bacterium]